RIEVDGRRHLLGARTAEAVECVDHEVFTLSSGAIGVQSESRRRCRCASKSRTEAAMATLRDSARPSRGIATRPDAAVAMSPDTPRASLPNTRAWAAPR